MLSLSYYVLIASGRIVGFITFPKVLEQCGNANSLLQDLNTHTHTHNSYEVCI